MNVYQSYSTAVALPGISFVSARFCLQLSDRSLAILPFPDFPSSISVSRKKQILCLFFVSVILLGEIP